MGEDDTVFANSTSITTNVAYWSAQKITIKAETKYYNTGETCKTFTNQTASNVSTLTFNGSCVSTDASRVVTLYTTLEAYNNNYGVHCISYPVTRV